MDLPHQRLAGELKKVIAGGKAWLAWPKMSRSPMGPPSPIHLTLESVKEVIKR